MKSKIKTVAQAFKYMGLDTKKMPGVSRLPKHHQKGLLAGYKLFVITEALNKEANGGKLWRPDWNDSDQWKYWPWFSFKAGSGFSYAGCDHWSSHASVGSRLCFKSRDLAEYAGKQFKAVYNDYLIIK